MELYPLRRGFPVPCSSTPPPPPPVSSSRVLQVRARIAVRFLQRSGPASKRFSFHDDSAAPSCAKAAVDSTSAMSVLGSNHTLFLDSETGIPCDFHTSQITSLFEFSPPFVTCRKHSQRPGRAPGWSSLPPRPSLQLGLLCSHPGPAL